MLTEFFFIFIHNTEIISLHNNNLMGDIEFFCAMEPRPVISADCGGESPEVICSCCAVCAALDRPDAGELSLPFNL